jgi:hypothetical protein
MYDIFFLKMKSGGDQLERLFKCVLIIHTILEKNLNIKAKQHTLVEINQNVTSPFTTACNL